MNSLLPVENHRMITFCDSFNLVMESRRFEIKDVGCNEPSKDYKKKINEC